MNTRHAPQVAPGTGSPRPRDTITDPGSAQQEYALVPSPVAHRMSATLAVATVAATAPTVLLDGVLHGTAAMNGSARGTALGMLVLGVPLLVGGQLATRRGVAAALPVWLGAVAYLLYNAFMLLFATPFNDLFLIYVATFSLALWSLVAIVRVVDVPGFGARIRPGVRSRPIAILVCVIVTLNAAAWLRAITIGLADSANPPFLEGTGLATAPTYVQDLAVWLPLTAVAAGWLWRGLTWGYLVITAMLATWVAESLTIAADQYLGSHADPESTVVSAAMSPAFLIAAVVLAVPLVHLLRRLRS